MERQGQEPSGGGPPASGGRRFSAEAWLSGKSRAAARVPVHAALERDEAPTARQRLKCAFSVPAVAGGIVFVLAITAALFIAILQMRPAAEASSGLTESLSFERPRGEVGGSGNSAGSAGPDKVNESSDTPAMTGGDTADIYVHVVGEVVSPGVVQLSAGARISDAVEAAGGVTENAVLSAVNLARQAVDGEQLLVPNAEQVAAGATSPPAVSPGASGPVGSGGSGGPVLAPQPINLNSADAASLETLPRVGPALARRILDWRDQNGGFTSAEQLLSVSGIGAKTFEGLRDLVTVQ